MNNNAIKKVISIMCLLIFGVLLLLPAFTLLLMSFKDYKLISGLLGSPYVGLANIQEFLGGTALINVLKNTLNINIFAMVIGAFYLFVAILAINVFQNRFIRAIVSLIFVLPAILPSNTYIAMLQAFLPTDVLINSSVLLQLIAGAASGLRFASVFVIAALFTKGESIPNAQKYVLLFVALKFIHFLVTDIGFMNSFYNPLTYEHLDTYSTYQLRLGLMQAQFSSYAAGYVVQLLIQLLPALLGIFIIASPFKKKRSSKKVAAPASSESLENPTSTYQAYDSGNRIYLPCMLLAIVPIALFLLIWKTCAVGSPELALPRIQQAYAYGFLTAGVSAAVVVCIGLLLAVSCIHLGSIGIGVTAFLYFLSDTLLGPYMIERTLGFHNTIMGVLVQNTPLILPVAIIGFRILKEHRRKNLLPALTISSLGLAFSWFWSDHMAPLVTLSNAEKQPLSLVMHQWLNQPAASAPLGMNTTTLSFALYILIPILITGLSFIVGSCLLKKYE